MKTNSKNLGKSPRAKRSGMIMPLVATIMVFIFLIGIAMLKVGFGSRFIAARTSSEIAARTAADAGLGAAMFEIKKRGTGMGMPPVTGISLPNSRASYSYTVEPVSEVDSGHPNTYKIRSVGTADGHARTVYATTWAISIWSFAILVDGQLSLKSKMTIGVWDPYGDYPDFVPTIGTTSTIDGSVDLFPNTEIPGDIVVGAGSDPEDVINSKASSTVSGDMYALDSDIVFPPVIVPEGLAPTVWLGEPNITEGRYRYDDPSPFILTGTLTIEGNVTMYVAGDMLLKNEARLYVAPGASLALYLGGDFEAFYGGNIINATFDARNLLMFGTPTCTSIIMKNSVDFWGAVYAPSADLYIFNSAKSVGSFIGASLEMKNSSEFYYDPRLYDGTWSEEPKFFFIQRWWERGDDIF